MRFVQWIKQQTAINRIIKENPNWNFVIKDTISEIISHKDGDGPSGNFYARWADGEAIYRAKDATYYSFDGQLLEGVDFPESKDFESEYGGMIVFSTSVNSEFDLRKPKDFFQAKIETIINKLKLKKILNKAIEKLKPRQNQGYTIGHGYIGKYINKDNKTFTEESLTLELLGVDAITLAKIGVELCEMLNQTCVLIKDYESGKFFFATKNKLTDEEIAQISNYTKNKD